MSEAMATSWGAGRGARARRGARSASLRGRAAAAAFAAWAGLIAASCSAPMRLDSAQLDVARRADAARAGLADPRSRAIGHLELAWLCLLHDHGCADLPTHADAVVAGAPDMDLAQLTRALGLQGTADVGERARAWLDLAWWSAHAARPSSRALGQLAVLAAARLAALDHAAAVAALRDAVVALDAVILGATPLERWRLRAALDGLVPAAMVPTLHAEDALRPQLLVQAGLVPFSRRAFSGLDLLPRAWQLPEALVPLAAGGGVAASGQRPVLTPRLGADAGAEAVAGPREDRFGLPPVEPGIWPLSALATLPAGRWGLLIDADRALRLRLHLGSGEAVEHDVGPGLQLVELGSTAVAAGTALRLELAMARVGDEKSVLLALTPLDGPAGTAAGAAAGTAAGAGRGAATPATTASRAPSEPAASAVSGRPVWADAAIALTARLLRGDGRDPSSGDASAGAPATPKARALAALAGWEASGEGGPDAALLDRLLDLRDDHVDARVRRARLAREEGQANLARSLLTPLRHRLDAGDRSVTGRADLRLELGWTAIADGLGDLGASAAVAAVQAQPSDCQVLRAALELVGTTLERTATRKLLAHAGRCQQYALELADAAAGVGDVALARSLLRQARRSAPLRARADDRLASLDAIADLVPAEAAVVGGEAPGSTPAAPQTRVQRQRAQAKALWQKAQVALAAGAAAAARGSLSELLVGAGVDADLRLQAWRLGAQAPWGSFLLDGKALALSDDAVGFDDEGAESVWLFDQEVVVLLPGGGALRRVHQIARVVDAAAAGKLGEVSVPVDAELELARTIQPDGTILAPAHTPDKETLSLRGVVPEAVVEFAQVQVLGPDDPALHTTRLPMFVLASSDGPIYRSDYVVLAPPGVEPQFEVGAEAPAVQTGTVGTWRSWRWTRERAPRWQPEPRANRPERTLPTVRVSVAADVAGLVEQVQEVLAAHLLRRDLRLQPWVDKAQAAGRDVEAWRQLVSSLMRSVEDGGSTGMPDPPERTVREGKGDRAALLWHLARRAGVRACLLRIAPWTREPPWQNADLADYGLAAVALELDADGKSEGSKTRTVVFDTGIDGGLVDVLRPGLRNRPMLKFGCGAAQPLGRTGDLGAETDHRDVQFEVTWKADGAVVVQARDTLRGVLGVVVRNMLVSGDEGVKGAVLRQLASASFPGMEATWEGQEGLDDDRKPLVLRWRIDQPATPERQDVLHLGLVPYRLGRDYAALPRRAWPLRFGHEIDMRVRVTVVTERGRIHAPDDAQVGAPGLSWSLLSQQSAGRLVLESNLRAKMGVVPAASYPSFAATLHAIDAGEMVRLVRSGNGPAFGGGRGR